MSYSETMKTFIETIKIFQEKNQTLSQAYRMAWAVPMRFYSAITPEQAYAVLNERYSMREEARG